MSAVAIRSAAMADMDGLIALAEACAGAPRWTRSTWEQVMDSAAPSATRGERQSVLVAECDAGLMGFGVVGMAGEAAEIESLAVRPGARRQGIGRSLCEASMRWAAERGASRALLEVRVSNDAARALYESLGFREVAVRRGYYREPDEDGLTMERVL